MHTHIMHTMDTSNNRNPVIRVETEARKLLKLIAVECNETMQETVTRLARAEMNRIYEKRRNTNVVTPTRDDLC